MQAVIFDCDGVLVDSESIIIGIWHQLAVQAGATVSLEQLFAEMTGQTMDTCRDIIALHINKDVEQSMRDQAWQLIGDAFKTDLHAFDQVHSTLAWLQTRAPIAVASNSEQPSLDYKLAKTELAAYFAGHCYSAQRVKQGKPAPDVYLFAAQQLGIEPSQCLVIEDSPLGVQAGKAAGMRVWALNHASDEQRLWDKGCDKVFASMAEVFAALQTEF